MSLTKSYWNSTFLYVLISNVIKALKKDIVVDKTVEGLLD